MYYHPDLLGYRRNKAFIYAPGPSLSRAEIDLCFEIHPNQLHVAVGNAHLIAPNSNLLHHSDSRWWNYHRGVKEFKGFKTCFGPTLYQREVFDLRVSGTYGFEKEPGVYRTGGNSGCAAISVTAQQKPSEIYLLGFDLKYRPQAGENFCGDHPKGVSVGHKPEKFLTFIQSISRLAPFLDSQGIKVYNCTQDSALGCFERVRLSDVV